MEANHLPPGQIVPSTQASDSLEGAASNAPVSSYSPSSQQYPLESLEVHSENANQGAQDNQVTSYASSNSVPFSRRKATIVSLVVTLMVVLLTGVSAAFLLSRQSRDQENPSQLGIPQQDVNVGEEITSLPDELEVTDDALLVNGDVISRGDLQVVSGDFVSTLRADQLTNDQVLVLPDDSGTICLDVNNCDFATTAELAIQTNQQTDQLEEQADTLAALQDQLDQLAIPPAGVTTLNNQAGSVSIQGTANRVSVSTSGGTITLSTPQDIATISSPTFAGLQINGNITTTGTVTLSLDCTGFSNSGKLTTNGSGEIVCANDVGGGGGTAPGDAEYLVLSLDGTLTDERAIASGTNISFADGGANGNFTIAVADNPTFSGLITANGNILLEAGDTLTVGGEAFSDLTGTGLQFSGGSLQTTLGTAIDTSEITNDTILEVDLDITNVGGAGVDNYVLTYDDATGGFTWVDPSNVGSGTDFDITDGSTTQNIVNNDTITFVDGTDIDAVVSATDTISISNISTLATVTGRDATTTSLVNLNGGIAVDTSNFTVSGTNGNVLTAGDISVQGGDIVLGNTSQVGNLTLADGSAVGTVTISTEALAGDYTVNFPTELAGTDTFCLETTGNCSGTAQNLFETINAPNGTDPVADSSTDTLNLTDGTNITVTGTATTDTIDIAVVDNPTFSGLVTANGNFLLEAGDTFTIGGQAFDDLTGTGLQFNAGSLETTLGTAINTSEITDDTILEVDLDITNVGGAGVDNYVLTYDDATGGFTWVDPSNVGSGTDFDITDGSTTENITNNDTLTFADGTDINAVVSATDTVTINNTSDLSTVTGRGATTTTLLNLNGGIAVDTSNFTVSGTNGNVQTAGDITVQGGDVTLGTTSQIGRLTLADGSVTGTVTISTEALDGDYTVNFPTELSGNDTFCLETTDNCAAAAQNLFETIDVPTGTDPVATSATDTLSLTDGTNIAITGTGSNTIDIAVVDNPTFSGLVTANGNFLLEAGDTFTIGGQAFDDLTGSGLSIISGDLSLGPLTANWNQTGAFDIVLNNSGSELVILDSDGTNSVTLDVDNLTADVAYQFANPAGGAGTYDICTTDGNCLGGGSGGAPANAQYLTLALDGNLTAERVLNPGSSLTVTDNGANGNYDINTIQDIRTTASPTFASPTFTGTLAVQGSNVTVGTSSSTNGSLVLLNSSNAFGVTINAANQTTGSATISLPDTAGVGDTFCLSTLGNCFGAGTGNNLQAAYNAGNTITTTDARDIDITLANTTTDASLLVDIATGSTGRFAVQGNGTDVIGITSTSVTIDQALTVNANTDIGTNTIQGTTAVIDFSNFDVDASGNVTAASNIDIGSSASYEIGGVAALQSSGGYLRINESSQFANGIYTGSSPIRVGGSTGLLVGSTGADGQIGLIPNGADTTRRITLDGGTGDITTAGDLTVNGGQLNIYDGTANTLTIQAEGAIGGDYTISVPTEISGADFFCLENAGNCTGSSSFDITDSTTTETIGNGDTVTFADGTDINVVVSATDTVTVNNTSNLDSVTGRGASTTNLVNLNGGLSASLADTENVAIANTVTGSNAVNLVSSTLTNNSSSGTQRVGLLQNAAGTGSTESILTLDNADTDTAVIDGLIITSAAGGITDGIDLSDADITNAINIGSNAIAGTNFSVTGIGAVTAVGVDVGSGLLQGTGGSTLTGAINLNTTGTANTAIGNATGTFAVTSSGLNVTTAGAISGATTLSTSGTITLGALGSADSDTILCHNGSNIIATCSSTFAAQSYVTLQNAYTNSSSPEITLDGTRGAVTIRDNATPIGANLFEIQDDGATADYFAVDTSGATIRGDLTLVHPDADSTTHYITGRFTTNIGGVSPGTVIQNSSTNSDTYLQIAANGTGTSSGIVFHGGDVVSDERGSIAYDESTSTLDITAATFLSTASGTIRLRTEPASGSVTSRFEIDSDGNVDFNPTGTDSDFTIQGDNNTELFYIDAGNDRVGIGTDVPSDTLEIIGNLAVADAETATKNFRFRTDGTNIDFENAGADLIFSVWDNADFGGTQRNKLAFEDGNDITQAVGQWQFRNDYEGTTHHSINGSSGGDVQFNIQGDADRDFQVSGDTQTNLLFVDASADAVGLGTNTPDGLLELAGDRAQAAWGLNGIQLQASAATYTDSSTAASGTATNAVFNSFATPILAATNSSVTTTNAATVYIQGAPTAGTNQTISNAYALWIDSGMTRLDGDLTVDTDTLHVDSANNRVGIGTDSPGYALHLVQAGQSSTDGFRIQEGSNFIDIYNSSANTQYIEFDETFVIGNVGTNSESGRLLTGRSLRLKTYDDANLGEILFDFDNTIVGGFESSSPGVADFYVDTNSLFVDSSANSVGIGTSTPEALLEIQGAEATDAVLALDADDGDDATDTWFIESEAADNDLSILNGTNEVLNISSSGHTTHQIVSDSDTAFVVQDAASQSYLTVDTNNLAVEIGGGTDDVVLVLDAFNSDPASAADGAMFYDADDDVFRCRVNGAWANCSGGSTVTLTRIPEFAGGTLSADGSNNTGTMSADFVNGLSGAEGEKHNYYDWSTAQASAQDYDVVVNVQLPSDFTAMGAASTFSFWHNDPDGATTNASTQWTVYDEDETQCFQTTFEGASAGVWEQESASSLGSCSFAANDIITFVFKLTTRSADGSIQLGEFEFQYDN